MLTFLEPIRAAKRPKKAYSEPPPWSIGEYVDATREHCFMLRLEGLSNKAISFRTGLPLPYVYSRAKEYERWFAAKLRRNMRRCRFVVSTHD